MKNRVKRTRSPCHAEERPHRAPGSPRRRGPASDARRIAELEAEVDELRGKMAALEAVVGVDLHDSDEVRALWAAQHRNGGGSGFGLLHVQHESGHRVSEAVLAAVRTETERLAKTALERVSDTVLARWAMPHGVVPSLVAEHVVVPFTEPDWVVSGPGVSGTAVVTVETVGNADLTIEWSDPSQGLAPTGQRVLTKLAALASSPAHVVGVCKLLPDYFEYQKIPWSSEFFANFFCALAPHATTAEVVEVLCRSLKHNCDDYAVVDLDSVQRFFVALVPGITAAQPPDNEVIYLFRTLRRGRSQWPFPDAFYREFVLPLARRASSSGMVLFLCEVFLLTFSASWPLAEDVPGVLTKFCQIITAEAEGSRAVGGCFAPFPAMVECVACNATTVGLVSDVADTAVLPLVPWISDKCDAVVMLKVLSEIVADRSRDGDAGSQQEVEQAMKDLRRWV